MHGNGLFYDALGISNDHETPGEGTCALSLGNVVALLGDGLTAVATRLPFDGCFGEGGGDGALAGYQEHAWIVVDVAFTDEQLCVVGI